MSDRFVTIASYYSPIEAQFAKNRLTENGITAGLLGDAAFSAFGFMGGLSGAIDLQVAEADRDQAILLLEQFEAEEHNEEDDETARADEDRPLTDAIRPPRLSRRDDSAFAEEQPRSRPTAGADPTWTCPRCGIDVTAERQLCPGCGASCDEKAGQAIGEAPPVSTDASPVVDDALLQELETAEGDAYAARAWRLAIFGFFFCFFPIGHLISLALVIWIAVRQYELSPTGKRNLVFALAVDGVWLLFLAILFKSLSR
jgi:hypothetical protein